MNTGAKNERVAILLKSLGNNVATNVLGRLSPDRASNMESAINQLETLPPTEDEVTEVLEEFHRFMEFALANSKQVLDEEEEEKATLAEFVSTGDPFADLQSLHDYQLAGALRSETGSTIAVVLSQLPDQRAGEVMRQLPDEVREEAFLRLQASPSLPKPLLSKIVQSTVERASRLDQNSASDPDHVADEKTARLLRAMDRKTRSEMLAALEKAQPEVSERVKGLLFVFEDLLRTTDKSIQRLLAEVEVAELATALKNAGEDIVDRVTSNLSKRAKATLLEEIEYLGTVSKERDAEARKAICDIFAQLDQAGELEMME